MRRPLTTTILLSALSIAACDDSGGGGGQTTTDATTSGDSSGDATATTDSATTATDSATTATDTTTGTTTTTQDTSTSTDVVDDTAGTCPGIILCFSECPSPVTAACQQACLAEGTTAERAAVTAVAQCQVGCFPTAGDPPEPTPPETQAEWRDTYECLYENCVDEQVLCDGGGVFGAGSCLDLNNCLVDCEDIACSRACLAAATEDAANNLFALDFCIQSQCYNPETVPPVSQACGTQAQQNPPCSLEYNQCLGNTGAAPGAGGGGGGSAKQRAERSAADPAARARLMRVFEAMQHAR